MLDKLKILGLFLLTIFLTGCPEKEVIENDQTITESNEKTDLSTFELFYSNAGGMSPESEYIYISSDSASWKYGRYLKETIITWHPTIEEIQIIIDVLNENNYLKIKSTEEEGVYDRGGVDLKIIHNNLTTRINHSGLSFVNDEWLDEFMTIKKCIKDYSDNEVRNQLLKLKVDIKSSISQNNEPISVWLNNQLFYKTLNEKNKPIEFNVYPGINRFSWTIYYADSVKYNNDPVFKFGGQNTFKVSKDAKLIGIKRIENEIILYAH